MWHVVALRVSAGTDKSSSPRRSYDGLRRLHEPTADFPSDRGHRPFARAALRAASLTRGGGALSGLPGILLSRMRGGTRGKAALLHVHRAPDGGQRTPA